MISKPIYHLIFLMLLGSALSFNIYAQTPVFEEKSGEIGIEDVQEIAHFYGHGAAVSDYDKDGDLDFYLTTDNGVVDRLYNNQGNGQFEDIAADVGLAISAGTRAALWFDYNGDQLLDLLVIGERCMNFKCGQPILIWLYKQNDAGNFIDVTEHSGLNFGTRYDHLEVYAVGGLAAGDLNNDNHLDLVITIWGGKQAIFLNNGDETFIDISVESGLGKEDKYYWQPMIHDFNQDGRMDIYNNVDFGKNQFWLNQGNNNFTEIAGQIGADSDFSEMGMALGDYDNDGDLDIYSTNITRDFNNEREHNIFLINETQNGNLTFTESSKMFGIDESGWDWGTTFIDINNDGWQDLVTTNGWNDPSWHSDRSKLWLNVNGSFTDFSDECAFNDENSATSLLAFDFDRDGDLDLLQTLKENDGHKKPAVIYENNLVKGASTNYLVVKPRMEGPNHFSIGAVVQIKSDNLLSTKLISAGTSFYGQEPAEAFFGVGNREIIEEVIINWPDGLQSVYTDVMVNQSIVLINLVVMPPTNVDVYSENEQIVIEWEDNADNEDGFIIQRAEDTGFGSFVVFEAAANQTSIIDTSAEPGKSYFYRVKGYNKDVSSAFSNVKEARNLITGINDQLSMDVTIYPNPANNHFIIEGEGPSNEIASLNLFDHQGRLIKTRKFKICGGVFKEVFEWKIPDGIYLVKLKYGLKVESSKLIISSR